MGWGWGLIKRDMGRRHDTTQQLVHETVILIGMYVHNNIIQRISTHKERFPNE